LSSIGVFFLIFFGLKGIIAEAPWEKRKKEANSAGKARQTIIENNGMEAGQKSTKKGRQNHAGLFGYGTPTWIRTKDPQIRSLILYPAELWAQRSKKDFPKKGGSYSINSSSVQKEKRCLKICAIQTIYLDIRERIDVIELRKS
jgi:hypothetical protein